MGANFLGFEHVQLKKGPLTPGHKVINYWPVTYVLTFQEADNRIDDISCKECEGGETEHIFEVNQYKCKACLKGQKV